MKNPKVFIILVNWNGLNDTIECLDSLKKISYPNYKIIVVDNGSKDNQADILKRKFPYIHLIKNVDNTGFVIANNQGIKYAQKNNADYYLLLNNDTVVDRIFLTLLINEAEKYKTVGILSPKILYYKSKKIWSMGGNISYLTGISIMIGKGKHSDKYKKIIEPDFLTGCAMLIKKEVVNKIGLLDPVYFAYYEDTDYSYRARKNGFKLKVFPKSIIWHKKSASAGIIGSNCLSKFQVYLQMRSFWIFIKKYPKLVFNSYLSIFIKIITSLVYGGFKSTKSIIYGLKNESFQA